MGDLTNSFPSFQDAQHVILDCITQVPRSQNDGTMEIIKLAANQNILSSSEDHHNLN